MNEEKSIIDFLTADEFQQCADEMIEGVKAEAEQINRPVILVMEHFAMNNGLMAKNMS